MQQVNKAFVIKGGLIGAALIAILSLSPWTIVSQGEVKVPSLFSEVQDRVLTEGLNFPENPLLSYDSYTVAEQSLVLEDVTIPSRDKFKSNADVTVVWEFDGSYAPEIRSTVGTQADLERKVLRAPLLSFLYEAGRTVEKAQDLFEAETQNAVQKYVHEKLQAYTDDYGITIKAVLVQDIKLPAVIQSAIETTKRLEEQEAQEQANLNKQKLVMQRGVEQARADAESAMAKAQAIESVAQANANAKRFNADADLYAKQAEAKGNEALAKSVTPSLLKLKQLEVDMQEMKSWKGGCTQNCTVMGDKGVTPLFHMNKQ